MRTRLLSTCGTSLGSLKLPAPEAGAFVELILLYFCKLVAVVVPVSPHIQEDSNLNTHFRKNLKLCALNM